MIKSVVRPAALRGEVTVPGDKSITHRAFILNAMAEGSAIITQASTGEDCASTLACLRSLGVAIQDRGRGSVGIQGVGLHGFRQPSGDLDSRNSGTLMRLLSGLLAGQSFTSTMTGDDSLRGRPMGRIIEPLTAMGARIEALGNDDHPPLKIQGGALTGIRYRLPVASAQVKSCLLIAGLYAQGETVVEEPVPTRDHTERMLAAMGADIRREGGAIIIRPSSLRAIDVQVPGDMSAAAYWIVAAVLHPDAEITVRNVGVNPTRAGILEVLEDMGAAIAYENRREVGGEPVADLRVCSSRLKGVTVGGDLIPRTIDELPLVALVGALAKGETIIRDAEELRLKESDRIAMTALELRKLGASVEERADGMRIQGGQVLTGAPVQSHTDHRLAMTLAVGGLLATGETAIDGAEAANISYPEFWAHLGSLSSGSHAGERANEPTAESAEEGA